MLRDDGSRRDNYRELSRCWFRGHEDKIATKEMERRKLRQAFTFESCDRSVRCGCASISVPRVWCGDGQQRAELAEIAISGQSAGCALRMFRTAGQRSDYIGARALLHSLSPAEHMLAERVYDADWYREALEKKGDQAAHPFPKKPQGADLP